MRRARSVRWVLVKRASLAVALLRPFLVTCAGGGGSSSTPGSFPQSSPANTVTQSDALRTAQSADSLHANLSVTPSSLTLTLPTPQTLTVRVTKKTTVFAASGDPKIAMVSPNYVNVNTLTAGSGTATFTVTPKAVGTAHLGLINLQGMYAVVPVVVQTVKSLLFVANAKANSVTAYPLDGSGNVAPVRTISGPATLLSDPISIAVDSVGRRAGQRRAHPPLRKPLVQWRHRCV
jgi:hypothetical protein